MAMQLSWGFPSEELVKWINSDFITYCLLDKN